MLVSMQYLPTANGLLSVAFVFILSMFLAVSVCLNACAFKHTDYLSVRRPVCTIFIQYFLYNLHLTLEALNYNGEVL